MRCLGREGFSNVLTATRGELDLRDQSAVNDWFRRKGLRVLCHAQLPRGVRRVRREWHLVQMTNGDESSF